MAFNFASFNKSGKKTVRDGIKSDEWEFKPLKDYIGKEIEVAGFFFTDGQYGKQVVVIDAVNGCKVNIPKRYTEDFEQIRDNEEARQEVLAGHLKLTDITAIQSKNGKSVAFNFASV